MFQRSLITISAIYRCKITADIRIRTNDKLIRAMSGVTEEIKVKSNEKCEDEKSDQTIGEFSKILVQEVDCYVPPSATSHIETASLEFHDSEKKRKKIDSKLMRKSKKSRHDKSTLETKVDDNEQYNSTSYYFENGLRKVYPYNFDFVSYCKGRWIGRSIIEVFSNEFRAYPPDEYREKIRQGFLNVNGKKVPEDYILQNGDLIKNQVHRHETPVFSGKSLEIVHMCDDLLVVDKPCSWPVHPCGRYRYNTVVFVLAKEYNIRNLRTIHRLDRLTSGLLLFGRSASRARKIVKEIRERTVSKEYVCRVEGIFPDGIIRCTESIEVLCHKLGMCKVGPNGKECATEFKRLNYNGKSSLVLCKPETGRMHQIRVHLQYLGHPISNDPLYNNQVFGKDKGKLANYYKTDEQLIKDYISTYNAETWLGFKDGNSKDDSNVESSEIPEQNSDEVGAEKNVENEKRTSEKPTDCFDESKMTYDATCYECKLRFKDPTLKDLTMYLHALRYKGSDWEFETKMPYWANDDFVED